MTKCGNSVGSIWFDGVGNRDQSGDCAINGNEQSGGSIKSEIQQRGFSAKRTEKTRAPNRHAPSVNVGFDAHARYRAKVSRFAHWIFRRSAHRAGEWMFRTLFDRSGELDDVMFSEPRFGQYLFNGWSPNRQRASFIKRHEVDQPGVFQCCSITNQQALASSAAHRDHHCSRCR